MNRLVIVPIDFAEANAFIEAHHRHHRPVPGTKFHIAVARSVKGEYLGSKCDVHGTITDPACFHCEPAYGEEKSVICGVAMVGRPVARMLDDGWTLEVNRTCTDGTKNVNSMLYGASWRATKALGYRRLITYILAQESGVSLTAAGWKCIGKAGGGNWSRASRPRVDKHPLQTKLRWEQTL